jgi:arylsulfatase A-like enzyme
LCLAQLVVGCAPPEPARNLVFISLDTTRVDHMSLYGYDRQTTPWMDEFFATGAVFENAVAQFNTTVPTHTSMLTAVYPHVHGNRRRTGFPEKFETLAEILKEQGFRTGAAVSGYPLKEESSTLDRGFEFYSGHFKGIRRDGGLTLDRALQWLRTVGDHERFFLFIHLYDAHGPYRENHHLDSFKSATPGPMLEFIPGYQKRQDEHGEVLKDLNAYLDRYDAQIRYQDEIVEKLMAEVNEKETLVLLTADHGETFAERAPGWNLNHGHNLYVEQTRIPLALRGPRVTAGRFTNIVETVDFLPTILELMEIRLERAHWQGASFAPVFADPRAELGEEVAFSSSDSRSDLWASAGLTLDRTRQIHALESKRWKLIRYPGTDEDYFELFNRESDPGEQNPVTASYPEVKERMSEVLAAWAEGAAGPGAVPRDREDDLEALRALGYVN